MILDDAQLQALTKKKRRDAQVRVLVALGVEHKIRPDGSLVVSVAHVEQLLGAVPAVKVERHAEPNWGALAKTTQ